MHEFDDAVLQCFLDNQEQLFPEGDVASNLEEAEAFLEESLAVVVNSVEEVWEFLKKRVLMWKVLMAMKFWKRMKFLTLVTEDT